KIGDTTRRTGGTSRVPFFLRPFFLCKASFLPGYDWAGLKGQLHKAAEFRNHFQFVSPVHFRFPGSPDPTPRPNETKTAHGDPKFRRGRDSCLSRRVASPSDLPKRA